MDSQEQRERAEKTTSEVVSLACYVCYLYFLTHPDKADEIKWWVQDQMDRVRAHVRHSLDFWESVISFSRRVDEIRALPEIENETA